MKKIPLIFFAFLCFTVSAFAQTNIQAIVDEAIRLARETKYKEAINEISKAIILQPDNARLYLTRAEFYYQIPDNPAGVKDLQTAAALSPNDEFVLYKSARELRRTGRISEALEIIDSLFALKLSNRSLNSAYRLRSDCKYLVKDYAGALEDVFRILELMPSENTLESFDEANIILRQVSRSGDANFSELLKILKNDPNIFLYYERLFGLLEKRRGALVEPPPLPPSDIRSKWKSFESFSSDLKTYLRDVQFKWAQLYVEKGQRAKAVETLRKMPAGEQKWFDYAERATFYFRNEFLVEAEQDWNITILELTKAIGESKTPKDKAYLFDKRGDYYLYLEQFQTAIEDFEAAISLNPSIETTVRKKIDTVKQTIQEKTN